MFLRSSVFIGNEKVCVILTVSDRTVNKRRSCCSNSGMIILCCKKFADVYSHGNNTCFIRYAYDIHLP